MKQEWPAWLNRIRPHASGLPGVLPLRHRFVSIHSLQNNSMETVTRRRHLHKGGNNLRASAERPHGECWGPQKRVGENPIACLSQPQMNTDETQIGQAGSVDLCFICVHLWLKKEKPAARDAG